MAEQKKSGSGCMKWTIGCGSVLLIGLVLTGIAGYFLWKLSSGALSGVKYLSELYNVDELIVNESEYTPPEDDMLSLEQVESLVYIQSETKQAIGPEFAETTQQYQKRIREIMESPQLSQLFKLFSLPKKQAMLLKEAKEAQVEAINQQGLSRDEYEWIRNQARLALEIEVPSLDIKGLLEDRKQIFKETEPSGPVNQDNRKLLEPHRELLEQTLRLSPLGL